MVTPARLCKPWITPLNDLVHHTRSLGESAGCLTRIKADQKDRADSGHFYLACRRANQRISEQLYWLVIPAKAGIHRII
jgi:hypothetical protein